MYPYLLLLKYSYKQSQTTKGDVFMAWEDTEKDYIELLIDQKKWQEAYNCLVAYIGKNGEDSWAKNQMALVKDNLF